MEQRGDEIHATATEATGASREGVVRWVLGVGLVLIVLAFAIIVFGGALSQDDGPDSQVNVSREMADQESQASQRDGEPRPPAFGEQAGPTQSSNSAQDPAPAASSTPGDAPAGDPKPDAQ
ncbi:hypothetical protein GCM10011515_16250 [Tsuneonella deserti]|uniref:Preprotein translocase subunit SecG n=1 Tax=Tsuneonella deserti TaxID=2035528 RepID=A0ABQ1S7W1_9SPHN|nr:hypothetical protein [Tsuneonella deserti]GGD97192.1 hypothetical protein GCM10011515_16250 [Tsuneonella deserti]